MPKSLFGTDGVRGIANVDLTPELAMSIGLATASVLKTDNSSKFVIGRDTRLSGTLLECALSAGLCSMGAAVVSVGELPTPAIASIVRSEAFDAGIVISASHNPFTDNGIKLFGSDGYKLDDLLEVQIEDLIHNNRFINRPTGNAIGTVKYESSLQDVYANHLETAMQGVRLDGVRIVLDGANGAAYQVAPRIFSDLGAQLTLIHCNPNGVNINTACGSLHPQSLQQETIARSADIGIAFDGDADRVILIDENGCVVDGDRMMLLLGRHMQSYGTLKNDTVVGTIMSNMGLEIALRETGLKLLRAPVGDRYVSETMRRDGYVLGGEKSGHIIFGHLTTTGDGILTALQVLKVMQETQMPLSKLANQMTDYPQVLLGIKVNDRTAWEADDEVQRCISHVATTLSGRGRLNVRASGTEKLVRVMAEGPDQSEIELLAGEVAGLVQKKYGT